MSEHIYATDEHGGHWLTDEVIVRCRDCKEFDSKTDGCWWFSHLELQGNYSWAEEPSDVEPDGYCAWGVRRDA